MARRRRPSEPPLRPLGAGDRRPAEPRPRHLRGRGSRQHRHRRLLGGAAALLVLVALGVAMVAWPDDEGQVRSGAPRPPPSPPAGQDVLPLLGTSGSVPQRAALAVKIENTENGRPPTGLVEADIVFEEIVEGGLTRLLAVYQSRDPTVVGPVRSARSTDIAILAELGRPLFAWSGANPTFRAAVEAADLIDVGFAAAGGAYWRDDDRRAPYNLYASPEQLRAAVPDSDLAASQQPPDALFTYRADGAPLSGPGVEDASGYRATGSLINVLATSIAWDWDPDRGAWVRTQDGTPHVDVDGDRVSAANVLVRSTPYRDSGVRDSTGAVVPEAAMVGEGDAWLLSGGRAQPGRWHKPAPDAPTTYTALDGSPLRLAPGPTWVEVVPAGVDAIQ